MIRLTNAYTDKPIWINPDHVVDIGEGICEGEKATYITTVCDVDADGVSMKVKESIEEVASKIIEWKLLMEGYRGMQIAMAVTSNQAIVAGIAESMYHQKTAIDRLAGLEEQEDE